MTFIILNWEMRRERAVENLQTYEWPDGICNN